MTSLRADLSAKTDLGQSAAPTLYYDMEKPFDASDADPPLRGLNTLSERICPRLFHGIVTAGAPWGGTSGGHGWKRDWASPEAMYPLCNTLRRSPNNPQQLLGNQWIPASHRPQTNTGASGQTQFVPGTGKGRHLTGEGKR